MQNEEDNEKDQEIQRKYLDEIKTSVVQNNPLHFIWLQKHLKSDLGLEPLTNDFEAYFQTIDLTTQSGRQSLWEAICFAIEHDRPPFPAALMEIDENHHINYRCAEYLMQQLSDEHIRELFTYASLAEKMGTLELIMDRYESAVTDSAPSSELRPK